MQLPPCCQLGCLSCSQQSLSQARLTAALALCRAAPRRLRTGTSQAAPFVAGVIALVLQNSSAAAPADMRRLLVNSASAGQLAEVPGSGYASLAASSSPDLLLQNSVAAPVLVSPASLPPIASPSAGPLAFTLALSQQPTAAVQMALSVGERGSRLPGHAACPGVCRRCSTLLSRAAAACPPA